MSSMFKDIENVFKKSAPEKDNDHHTRTDYPVPQPAKVYANPSKNRTHAPVSTTRTIKPSPLIPQPSPPRSRKFSFSFRGLTRTATASSLGQPALSSKSSGSRLKPGIFGSKSKSKTSGSRTPSPLLGPPLPPKISPSSHTLRAAAYQHVNSHRLSVQRKTSAPAVLVQSSRPLGILEHEEKNPGGLVPFPKPFGYKNSLGSRSTSSLCTNKPTVKFMESTLSLFDRSIADVQDENLIRRDIMEDPSAPFPVHFYHVPSVTHELNTAMPSEDLDKFELDKEPEVSAPLSNSAKQAHVVTQFGELATSSDNESDRPNHSHIRHIRTTSDFSVLDHISQVRRVPHRSCSPSISANETVEVSPISSQYDMEVSDLLDTFPSVPVVPRINIQRATVLNFGITGGETPSSATSQASTDETPSAEHTDFASFGATSPVTSASEPVTPTLPEFSIQNTSGIIGATPETTEIAHTEFVPSPTVPGDNGFDIKITESNNQVVVVVTSKSNLRSCSTPAASPIGSPTGKQEHRIKAICALGAGSDKPSSKSGGSSTVLSSPIPTETHSAILTRPIGVETPFDRSEQHSHSGSEEYGQGQTLESGPSETSCQLENAVSDANKRYNMAWMRSFSNYCDVAAEMKEILSERGFVQRPTPTHGFIYRVCFLPSQRPRSGSVHSVPPMTVATPSQAQGHIETPLVQINRDGQGEVNGSKRMKAVLDQMRSEGSPVSTRVWTAKSSDTAIPHRDVVAIKPALAISPRARSDSTPGGNTLTNEKSDGSDELWAQDPRNVQANSGQIERGDTTRTSRDSSKPITPSVRPRASPGRNEEIVTSAMYNVISLENRNLQKKKTKSTAIFSKPDDLVPVSPFGSVRPYIKESKNQNRYDKFVVPTPEEPIDFAPDTHSSPPFRNESGKTEDVSSLRLGRAFSDFSPLSDKGILEETSRDLKNLQPTTVLAHHMVAEPGVNGDHPATTSAATKQELEMWKLIAIKALERGYLNIKDYSDKDIVAKVLQDDANCDLGEEMARMRAEKDSLMKQLSVQGNIIDRLQRELSTLRTLPRDGSISPSSPGVHFFPLIRTPRQTHFSSNTFGSPVSVADITKSSSAVNPTPSELHQDENDQLRQELVISRQENEKLRKVAEDEYSGRSKMEEKLAGIQFTLGKLVEGIKDNSHQAEAQKAATENVHEDLKRRAEEEQIEKEMLLERLRGIEERLNTSEALGSLLGGCIAELSNLRDERAARAQSVARFRHELNRISFSSVKGPATTSPTVSLHPTASAPNIRSKIVRSLHSVRQSVDMAPRQVPSYNFV